MINMKALPPRLTPIGLCLGGFSRSRVEALRRRCLLRQAAFQCRHQVNDCWRSGHFPGFDREPLHLGFNQVAQGVPVAVSIRRRIETSGPLTDDRASDRDHLGVEIPLDATELCRPELVCSAQHEERHAGAARLDCDHPLAPAERETPEPDDVCLGHRRADHPERFLRHRAIRVEVIGGVEIDGIEVILWDKLFEVDDLRAFDVECLQFLGGKRDELAATVFVTFDDFRLLDLLARSRIMRPDTDPGKGLGLICVIATIVSAKLRQGRLGNLLRSLWLRRLVSFIREPRSPHLPQANGFRPAGRRRQIDWAGHQRKVKKSPPTCPRHY